MKKWCIGGLLLLSGLTSQAGSLRTYITPEGKINFHFQGSIAKNDAEILKKRATELIWLGFDVDTIVLNSEGGLVREAAWMAMTIKSLGLNTVVMNDNYCASACVTVLSGGKNIHIEPRAYIGIHQASVNGKQSVEGTALILLVQKFLKFPKALNQKIINTPPKKIYWLTPNEKQLLRKGKLESTFAEWDYNADLKRLTNGTADGKLYRMYAGLAQLGLAGQQDMSAGLSYYLLGAEKGDVQSLFQISQYYLGGLGIPVNEKLGAHYLTEAGRQGDGLSLYLIGEDMSQEFSTKEYHDYWWSLTRVGYHDRIRGAAWRKLAELYEENRFGETKNPKKTLVYYRNGSAFGDPAAQIKYGRLLQSSKIEEEKFNGIMWVMTACAGGQEDACTDINRYLRDRGLK